MKSNLKPRYFTWCALNGISINFPVQVTALKKKIEEEQGSSFPAAGLKLIYAGNLLVWYGRVSLSCCNLLVWYGMVELVFLVDPLPSQGSLVDRLSY